jgi:hypothetical protein
MLVFRCRIRWPVWFIYLSKLYCTYIMTIVRYVVCAEYVSLWCKEIDHDFCVLLSDATLKDVIEFACRLGV